MAKPWCGPSGSSCRMIPTGAMELWPSLRLAHPAPTRSHRDKLDNVYIYIYVSIYLYIYVYVYIYMLDTLNKYEILYICMQCIYIVYMSIQVLFIRSCHVWYHLLSTFNKHYIYTVPEKFRRFKRKCVIHRSCHLVAH